MLLREDELRLVASFCRGCYIHFTPFFTKMLTFLPINTSFGDVSRLFPTIIGTVDAVDILVLDTGFVDDREVEVADLHAPSD